MRINPLVVDVGSPPIPEAQGWLAAYEGGHGATLDLSQAVPGVPPHVELLARLGAAARTREAAAYGAIEGDEATRAAYAGHLAATFSAPVSAADIALTAGCNQAFVVAMMALAERGDAVLLPVPWYFNHAMTLGLLGIEARPLPCRAEAGFVPDPDDAADLIDGRVKAIVLVSPNNPTGAIYPPATIRAFFELAARHGLVLVLDETYRDFLPPGAGAPHALLADPFWRETLIGLYSFSKAYCMPGHRVGAISAGPRFLTELAKILDCVQICAPRTPQMALAWAIPSLGAWREENRALMAGRADAFAAAIEAVDGWRLDALGAYFGYLRHPFAGSTSAEVAQRLASERGVLALPGSYFGPGQEQHLRVAFANVEAERIAELPQRLKGVG